MGIRGPQSTAELTTVQSVRSTTARDQKRKPPRRNLPTSPKPRQVAPSNTDNVSIKPPKHLKASKSWWRSIVDVYELEQHQLQILLVAAEALDRREEAREALRKHGMVYTDDRGMIRQRPEIAIEREMSNSFLRALRALKLESEAL
jgi:phage terminase small subunit